MYPILFKLGSVTIYTHGFLAVIGIVFGTAILYYLASKRRLDTGLLFDNVVYSVLAGIIGARITYYFLYKDQFKSFNEIFFLWQGGMVSYGGFILAAIAFYILLKAQKQNVLKWFDLIAVSFAMGLFWGRLGNIAAGEYSGVVTNSFLNINGLVPVTLFEGIAVLIIFLISFVFVVKYKNLKDGVVLYSFMILYGLSRFIIDFWRDEQVRFYNLGVGQLISILVFLFGLASLYAIFFNKRIKNGS